MEPPQPLLISLLCRPCNGYESLTSTEWVSVLALSTMWDFEAARCFAIQRLSMLELDPVDRIVLAQTHRVVEWLVPALVQLAQREEPLGASDVKKLGVDMVLKMARVRESLAYTRKKAYCLCGRPCGHRHVYSRSTRDFSSAVRDVFSL